MFTLAASHPALAESAARQSASASGGQTAPAARLRVALTCEPCDVPSLRTAIAFVDFVTPGAEADVAAEVSTAPAPDAQTEWRVAVRGAGRFAGRDRRLSTLTRGATPADRQKDLERLLKLALVEYAADTSVFPQLAVTHRRAASTPASPPHDPWNFWVYRVNGNMYASGQQSTSDGYYEVSASANRVTEAWKMRFGGYRGISRSSFQIDENETIKTRLLDWSTDAFVVKSLGPKWSLGFNGSASGSSFNNTDLSIRLMPGIEYDLFPYKESTKRSLTLQYNIGAAHYNFIAPTIYDKTSETTIDQSAVAALGLQQPWGQIGAGLQFAQQLSSPDRTRVTILGSFSLRILKSLTLNGEANYARIRDQFTIEKGEASDDEVLLRQRQLATGHRYFLSFGFSYSFGALKNTTVNPRFNN